MGGGLDHNGQEIQVAVSVMKQQTVDGCGEGIEEDVGDELTARERQRERQRTLESQLANGE